MLVQITGRTHRYGNQRLPLPGMLSAIAGAATVVAAFAAGHPRSGVFAAIGVAMLLIWLLLFNRISLPINKTLIAASDAGESLPNARALQDRWESIINVRATLQGLALLAFCLTIAAV